MKVVILILSLLAVLSAGQVNLAISAIAACTTAGGCSLSAILQPLDIVKLVTSFALGGQFNLDLSSLSTGSTINIDASGGFATFNKLYVSTLNTGTAVVNVASGFTVNTAAFVVAGGSNVTVSGTVAISGGAETATNASTTIAGYLYVAAGGAIQAGSSTVQSSYNTTVAGAISAGAYTQSSAYLVLNGATNAAVVIAASTINIQSGATVSGNGAIGNSGASGAAAATIYVDGTISVGNSPGVVTINGDWRPSKTATYKFEAASSSSFDKLVISGKAYLNGFCTCTLLNGYGPSADTKFYSITAAGGIDNTFFSTLGTDSGSVSKWSSPVNGNNVIITYGSAVSVAVSGLVLVACVLASLL